MPQPELFPIRPGAGEAARVAYVSWPVDWYDHVMSVGPLPVVLFLHGQDGDAQRFMSEGFQITGWWKGDFLGRPIKAIAIAPQAIDLHHSGAQWNAGLLGESARLYGVDDVQYIFDLLDRIEQQLVDGYNTEIGARFFPTLPPMTTVFDRSRLMIVGFSAGGQMAYRLAASTTGFGWTVTALCVFSGSIGGWIHEVDRVLGQPPNVDWMPATVPSLLHVHGDLDDTVNDLMDGISASEAARVVAQAGFPALNFYARSDLSGESTAVRFLDRANATAGWSSVPPVALASIPAVLPTSLQEAWDATGNMLPDAQVVFAHLGGLGHELPPFRIEATVEFLLRWGGL